MAEGWGGWGRRPSWLVSDAKKCFLWYVNNFQLVVTWKTVNNVNRFRFKRQSTEMLVESHAKRHLTSDPDMMYCTWYRRCCLIGKSPRLIMWHEQRSTVGVEGGPSSSGAVAGNRNAICAGVVECSQPFTKSTGGTSNYVVGCAKLGNVKLYLQVIYKLEIMSCKRQILFFITVVEFMH